MSESMSTVLVGAGFRLSHVFDKVSVLSIDLETEKEEQDIVVKSNIMSFKDICQSLVDVEVTQWLLMSQACGVTIYGVVALSWCKNAELSQVLDGWLALGFPFKALPEFERPARFINPTLLPKREKLSDILTAYHARYVENQAAYTLIISAAIVVAGESLELDIPYENLGEAQPQIASFLKKYMLQKTSRTSDDNKLIETWSEKIKGTEYDVWESS